MSEILFSPFKQDSKVILDSDQLENLIIRFRENENRLLKIKISELVVIFDQLSREWQTKDSGLYSLFVKHNIGFLISWLKKKNIKEILDSSLTNIDALDKPTIIGSKKLYAAPKGLVVHWIAGNVPLLGILSLFQALLAKNKNIVKVPNTFRDVLPSIVQDISTKTFKVGNKSIKGKDIVNSILIIYVDKSDFLAQSILSKHANIRYAWGGREAIENIIGLEKKIDCEDLVMGPKISISVISKEFLKNEESKINIAKKITRDVFAFDQRGCNAPHNIYIEKDKNSLEQFARILADTFQKESSKRKRLEKQSIDTFNILAERVLYTISEGRSAIFGNDYDYSVFIDNEESLPSAPLYNRSVYLKSIENIQNAPKLFPAGIQSVGVALPDEKIDSFSKLAIAYGALRIVKIGAMSIYDSPWDGVFPINRLVKWISVPI